MRNFFMLAALCLSGSSFAEGGGPPPLDFKIHIWSCSSVKSGDGLGYSVAVDHTAKGTFVAVSSGGLAGPQPLATYKVVAVFPSSVNGATFYADEKTQGRSLTLKIAGNGAGDFTATAKTGEVHRGKLRCFRTRGL